MSTKKNNTLPISEEEDRQKRIRRELTELRRLYRDLDKDEKTLPESVAEELAFMKVTLEELKDRVNKDGVVTEMVQGSYSIDRENPALKSYNATIQRYNTMVKQLFDMLDRKAPETSDERDIRDFIKRK